MKLRERSVSNIIFEENSPGFERLITLCDGIFAIAMTLLVLDIKLPEGIGQANAAIFFQEVSRLLEKSIFYLITFVTIAGYWAAHRRLMTYVKRQDRGFTSLTFLFLAFVVFFPVSFSVMVAGGQFAVVVIFYTLTLAGCGFSAFLLWAYASWNHRLIDANVSRREIFSRSVFLLTNPVYFCLSLLLLLIPGIEVHTVFYSWLLLPVVVKIVDVIRGWGEKYSGRSVRVAN